MWLFSWVIGSGSLINQLWGGVYISAVWTSNGKGEKTHSAVQFSGVVQSDRVTHYIHDFFFYIYIEENCIVIITAINLLPSPSSQLLFGGKKTDHIIAIENLIKDH